MPGQIWDSTADEFQDYVVKLLRRKYGHQNLVEIPDRDGGDHGLEAFTRDGCAYQCYAAEEPVNVPDLYDKQRSKITRDVKKFINNKKALAPLLDPTKISRWIFVVPRYESADLLIHAGKKAREVVASNLAYVAEEFCIQIVVLDYFAVERQQLAGITQNELNLQFQNVTGDEIEKWKITNDKFSETVLAKISKLRAHDEKERHEFTKDMIRHFLEGQNLMQNLLSQYPDVYKSVIQTKETRQNLLRAGALRSNSNQEHLNAQIDIYQKELASVLRGFSKQSVEQLVWAAIADWLMRCPLDFPIQEKA